ncbi:MAG: response regulator [Nitrospinae bacterium]|nr:response regulator [Nitrospinota bacterium]MCH8313330.1 response regulator [Nitrospinota bacterium]
MAKKKSIRVLIVDDSEQFTMFLRRNLLSRNYEIVGEAEDGEQAINLFKSEKPDLTLLDFEMPTTTGDEVLEEILNLNPDARVIMITGRDDIATMNLCIEKGAFHYIRKDYPPETIFSVIEESLAKVN